jgi:hypothetical protein
MASWFPFGIFSESSSELYLLEQALQNPKTCAPLNEWMDGKLDKMSLDWNGKLDKSDVKLDKLAVDQNVKLDKLAVDWNGKLDKSDVKLDKMAVDWNGKLDKMAMDWNGKLDKTDSKMENGFKATDAKFEKLEAKLDARFEKMEARLDDKRFELVELLKERNHALESQVNDQTAQIREMSGVVGAIRFLEIHNAELKARVEMLEQLVFKGRTPEA